MKEYFYKKEYKYMYFGSLFYNFANALIQTFGTVMLYKNGVPIWLILLIYGLRFGITGFFTPFFVTISSKFGIAKCILISNIFSIIIAYMLLDGIDIQKNIIVLIIAMGLMGISNPSSDALSSKYVETRHRGRYNSFINITKILGSAIATGLVAWGVISGQHISLFIIIAIFFLLHYFCIARIDYKPEYKASAFKATLKYIFISKSKYKMVYALRTNHIIERQFIPLYLYIILDDFVAFSSVIMVSLLLQMITITFVGNCTDKNISKSNDLVSIMKMMITGVFLFTRNSVAISINKMLNDNFEKVYETSVQTSIQNMIEKSKEDNDLLSAVGQMSLCFTEVIIFGILALISKVIGVHVFIVIFILSILSTIMIGIIMRQEYKRENI